MDTNVTPLRPKPKACLQRKVAGTALQWHVYSPHPKAVFTQTVDGYGATCAAALNLWKVQYDITLGLYDLPNSPVPWGRGLQPPKHFDCKLRASEPQRRTRSG